MAEEKRRAAIRKHLVREMAGPPQVASARLEPLQAESWQHCAQWRHDALPSPELTFSCDLNAASFHLWHEPVGTRGLQQLQHYAIRSAQGDADRGFDLAHDAWEALLRMLAEALERQERGLSLADFRRPEGGLGADNVTSWLRRLVIWLRDHGQGDAGPALEDLVPDRLPAEDEGPPDEGIAWSVATRFACLWFLADCRRQREPWWAMLPHALGLPAERFVGGVSLRGDPVRAQSKLVLRLRAALGLGPWLRQWAASQPGSYWSEGRPVVPRKPTSQLPLEPAEEALGRIRPALERAIAALQDLAPQAREGLVAVLCKGRPVEGMLASFSGQDDEGRLRALHDAAERAGRVAVELLAERSPPALDGPEQPGPPCGHGHERSQLQRAYGAGVPSPDNMREALQLLRGCDECRDWWEARCEGAALLPQAAKRAGAAEQALPTRNIGFRGWALPPVVILTVVLVFFGRSGEPEAGAEGDIRAETIQLGATVLLAGSEGASSSISAGSSWPPGTAVSFSLGQGEAGELHLLHRHPDGLVETLLPATGQGALAWSGTAETLRAQSGGELALELPAEEGRHQFWALISPGEVPAEAWSALPGRLPAEAPEVWASWMTRFDQPALQVGAAELIVELPADEAAGQDAPLNKSTTTPPPPAP